MNILPKKNWHVRNKDNVAKVRKDEREQAEKDAEIERRKRLADADGRLSFLREKAKETNPGSSQKQSLDLFSSSTSDGISAQNKEHEKEAREEKEAYEKKIGLLTFLGGNAREENPWWCKEITELDDQQRQKEEKKKAALDPLNNMRRKCEGRPHEGRPQPTPKKPRSNNMDELRRQRLARESKERAKADKLVGPKSRDRSPVDDRNREYNNVYNR